MKKNKPIPINKVRKNVEERIGIPIYNLNVGKGEIYLTEISFVALGRLIIERNYH
ncbi:MAG: hypothetical protein Fur0025_17080 [Oscillatoriaceae cyanobacterium]